MVLLKFSQAASESGRFHFSFVKTVTAITLSNRQGSSILELGGPVLLSSVAPQPNKRQIFTENWTEEAFVCPSHLPDAADRTSDGLKW